jgi:hypothetical protein
LEEAYRQAEFHDIQTRTLTAQLHLPSADECERFEHESFGALHQMLAGVSEAKRESVWEELANVLRQFETTDGFVGPCEMLTAGKKENAFFANSIVMRYNVGD